MNKKIYISGKIKDLPLELAKKNFETAKEYLEEKGWDAVNPFDIDPYIMEDIEDGESREIKYDEYIRGDLQVLCECNAIYMLDNWQYSNGAKIEIRTAIDLNLDIYFQKTNQL